MPLHLIKLAVGAQNLDDVKRWQASRPRPLKHQTRNTPRRAAEIVDGGSIYWVINRFLTARQRIVGIEDGKREDGTGCTDLLLDPTLIQVQARAVKPFQGWRYLQASDAPADVAAGSVTMQLPEALRRELAALCLL
jgi:hypothetical protein